MRRISRADFSAQFPLPEPGRLVAGIEHGVVKLDRDSMLSGIVDGDLVVRDGANVTIVGIVNGSVTVERDSVLYHYGIVKGDLRVRGAACVDGIVGAFEADDDAVVALERLVERRAQYETA